MPHPSRRTFLDHIKDRYLPDEYDKSTFPTDKDIVESHDSFFRYPVKESYQQSHQFWFLPAPSFDMQGRTVIFDAQTGSLESEQDRK